MKKKKRRINFQKIFSFASFIFILVCIFWYGGRFIYFYNDSKKIITEESKTFARIIKTNNNEKETFKLVDKTYYFTGMADSNYIEYSNMLWRIIKVNKDNTIVVVSDSTVGTLPFGDDKSTYTDSIVLKWLNQKDNEETYHLESKLNQKETFLVKSKVCVDAIDSLENIDCNTKNEDYYLGLLSIQDYINTGGNGGFINNGKYSYFANQNTENLMWYLNQEGKLDVTEKTEFLGIKTVITLSSEVEVKSGTGTLNDPYKIEDNKGIFASYIKLGEDLWRVYDEKDNILKLVANEPIKVDGENYQSVYSKKNYYHNDTAYGTLAYYLNNTYLNSLSYKDIILENTYVNGFYGIDNNYEYKDILDNVIETKVSVPSLGDIILNDTLDNYFTNTGVSKDSSLLYLMKENGIISTNSISIKANVVPCISISRENLKGGSGSLNDPYRMEP